MVAPTRRSAGCPTRHVDGAGRRSTGSSATDTKELTVATAQRDAFHRLCGATRAAERQLLDELSMRTRDICARATGEPRCHFIWRISRSPSFSCTTIAVPSPAGHRRPLEASILHIPSINRLLNVPCQLRRTCDKHACRSCARRGDQHRLGGVVACVETPCGGSGVAMATSCTARKVGVVRRRVLTTWTADTGDDADTVHRDGD